MNGVKRPRMLPKPLPHYPAAWSIYPDSIRISFDDGKTLRYVLEETNHEPVIGKMLDRFEIRFFGGNKYKTKGRAKRTGKIEEETDNG